jgi:hypothetical protein
MLCGIGVRSGSLPSDLPTAAHNVLCKLEDRFRTPNQHTCQRPKGEQQRDEREWEYDAHQQADRRKCAEQNGALDAQFVAITKAMQDEYLHTVKKMTHQWYREGDDQP